MSKKGEELIDRLGIELNIKKIEINLTRTEIQCLLQHVRGLKRQLNFSYNQIDKLCDDLSNAYY